MLFIFFLISWWWKFASHFFDKIDFLIHTIKIKFYYVAFTLLCQILKFSFFFLDICCFCLSVCSAWYQFLFCFEFWRLSWSSRQWRNGPRKSSIAVLKSPLLQLYGHYVWKILPNWTCLILIKPQEIPLKYCCRHRAAPCSHHSSTVNYCIIFNFWTW